ncbi:MAG: hypothetical protein SGI83_07555, partial [Bacteroidota bacterium]|nr:hypothetical protein [Bacteroidota bacterium]
YSHPVEKPTGVKCDQTIHLKNYYAFRDYPDKLRRIKFYDEEQGRYCVFLTNNFQLKAALLHEKYKKRKDWLTGSR